MQIKELMELRGIQGTQVAAALNVSSNAVSKWTSGRANPSADKLPALADVLGCSIDALFGREPAGEAQRPGA